MPSRTLSPRTSTTRTSITPPITIRSSFFRESTSTVSHSVSCCSSRGQLPVACPSVSPLNRDLTCRASNPKRTRHSQANPTVVMGTAPDHTECLLLSATQPVEPAGGSRGCRLNGQLPPGKLFSLLPVPVFALFEREEHEEHHGDQSGDGCWGSFDHLAPLTGWRDVAAELTRSIIWR